MLNKKEPKTGPWGTPNKIVYYEEWAMCSQPVWILPLSFLHYWRFLIFFLWFSRGVSKCRLTAIEGLKVMKNVFVDFVPEKTFSMRPHEKKRRTWRWERQATLNEWGCSWMKIDVSQSSENHACHWRAGYLKSFRCGKALYYQILIIEDEVNLDPESKKR